jgi:thymidylate synthase ThyX
MYISEVKGQGNIVARVVADSISETGKRITTFELEYHRFIHSELMTHRHFSRNAMSSRAVPISKMIEQVRTIPATPIHWGKNQAGMQAEIENSNYISCPEYIYLVSEVNTKEMYWSLCAKAASDMAEQMPDAGYHKQIVNRLLEPFQMMKTVLTATELDNFFWLRLDADAQPEIQELAKCMYEALQKSKPELLLDGEWHTPYVTHHRFNNGDAILEYVMENIRVKVEEALAISASCCAQVSYRTLNTTYDKAMAIYDKLLSGGKPHCSPFEHQATPATREVILTFGEDRWPKGVTHIDSSGEVWSGNFCGWIQHRQLLDNHTCYHYEPK